MNKSLKNKVEVYELFIKHIYENNVTYNDLTCQSIWDAEDSLTKEQKTLIDKLK